MMLLVVQYPPPTANVDEPQTLPEGEITSTTCSHAALDPGVGKTAYPLPPWTMCSVVLGRDASHGGGGDIEVACASNGPSQPWNPETNRPLSARSKSFHGRYAPPLPTAWKTGPGAPLGSTHCPAKVPSP